MKTRNALTLVELLAVVVVISILAGLSIAALSGSMQAARETKTQATIQKLDAVMMGIYEQYEDRFDGILYESNWRSSDGLSGQQEALLKLHLIHDLMRMELPQNWTDIADSANDNITTALGTTIGGNSYRVNRPGVLQYYHNAYTSARANVSDEPNRGALLFLIVANLDPEALEGFGASEIADTDGDGLMEFVDGWGKPIMFLRWAPAVTGTDRQPDIITRSGVALFAGKDADDKDNTTKFWGTGPNNSATAADIAVNAQFQAASGAWSDPFDPNGYLNGWFMYPLIYSAGRDGVYDIYSKPNPAENLSTSPYGSTGILGLDPFCRAFGMPIDDDGNGELNHYDNIHNHRHPGGF